MRFFHLAVICMLVFVAGCGSVGRFLTSLSDGLENFSNGIEKRAEQRDGEDYEFDALMRQPKRIQQVSSTGNYFKWAPSRVQKTKIPSMIRGGVYIPAHEEEVILTDAAYVVSNDRIDDIRAKYGVPAAVEMVSPAQGDDVVVVTYRLAPIFDEPRIVDVKKVSFLLHNKSIEQGFALSNGEVSNFGGILASFNRENKDISVSAVISGMHRMKTYTITIGQVMILENGYVIAPLFEKKAGKRRERA